VASTSEWLFPNYQEGSIDDNGNKKRKQCKLWQIVTASADLKLGVGGVAGVAIAAGHVEDTL
jgi:hypothetical protein